MSPRWRAPGIDPPARRAVVDAVVIGFADSPAQDQRVIVATEGGSRRADRGESMHKFKDRRSPIEPADAGLQGFYRVGVGSLVEIGDQTVDESGRPCPISLDQVGREVTRERIVLRIDRRRHD